MEMQQVKQRSLELTYSLQEIQGREEYDDQKNPESAVFSRQLATRDTSTRKERGQDYSILKETRGLGV